MRIIILYLGLLQILAPSQCQSIVQALANVRAADASEKIREHVNKHPLVEERANFDDVLEDLKATNQAIHMSPRRTSTALSIEDFREEVNHVKQLARMLRPSVRSYRRNLESPQGLGHELDVILRVIKTAILNVIDMIERSMPITAPFTNMIRMGLTSLFG